MFIDDRTRFGLLKLAQEAEKDETGYKDADAVVARAKIYAGFIAESRDADLKEASAKILAEAKTLEGISDGMADKVQILDGLCRELEKF